ncbi:hypothetical protein QYE76_020875 [Lolium multiflorum]|uniref:Transposase (putative) gypsy type domain-containing protein n=1 Tax=Lolium multiflorum TaxID=4521 RepID=A0AAD8R9Q5_LOLMU|nr:hypothetical protein QYE76_020875 [Lolium multiflorum]
MISAHRSFIRDTVVPKPGAGEVVMTKAWVERGLSLPCSEFFLSVLNTYGLQPHNICPNSYLLLSNFATLCEGHLGIRPTSLWQFFFRVKKETKDKAMLNCGSMTFMLRPGRMYPPHDSHESVRYWNAGWFYEKNASVPEIHDGLPKFNNEPPEELASWSFIPSLSLTPILEKAARRISARYIGGGKLTHHTRVPVGGDTAEEVPEDEEEEEEPAPQGGLRPTASPRQSFRLSESGEASAKKPKIVKPPPLDSRKAERERLKMLSTAGKHSRPIIPARKFPGMNSDYRRYSDHQPKTHHRIHEEISGCWSCNSSSAKRFPAAPPPSPPQADQSPPPAANTPPEIIPVSEKVGGEDPKAKGPAQEETQDQGEAEVTSSEKAYATKFFNKLTETEKWDLEQDLLNAMLNNAWGKPDATTSEIQDFKKGVGEFFDKLVCKQKRNADSETIKRQQGAQWLRYMETAEHHWDLLAKNILEPLGYPEKRRNKFPRDDVLSLAGDDCKDLISASRKICHNLSLKRSRTCGLRKLIKRMDILPELVTDLQASSARGAAAMTLTMCLAHNPKMDLDRVTSGVPPTADVGALLDAVSGYDTRIARRIRHEEFYDKVVLPADEPLKTNFKKSDAEARPAESGTQFTWTSSKDAPEEEPKTSAATSDEDEESDEDVSSPAEGAKGKDPEVNASPSKAE